MRDSYDDEYVEKMKRLDFSCSMVLSMKKIFFGTGVNVYVEDNILRHLLTCETCRRAYTLYAKEVGYKKFNLIRYAIQFAENNKVLKDCKVREYLNEVRDNTKVIALSKPWTNAANRFEIDEHPYC